MKKLFCFTFLSIIFIINNVKSNEKIWEHQGKYLTEGCFVHEWISGDNFEEFYDRYGPKVMEGYKGLTSEMSEKQKINFFFEEIGNFYDRYIPIDETFKASWGNEQLSLTTNLDDCAKNTLFELDKYKDFYELVSNPSLEGKELKTKCSRSITTSKAKCLDVQTIEHTQVFPAMDPYSQVIVFGIYEYNNKKIILPLKFNVSLPKEIKRTKGIRDDFFDWLRNQNEILTTNELFWNEDFQTYLVNIIPQIDLYLGLTKEDKDSLFKSFSSVISGPPNVLKYSEDQRYLTASACRAHECTSKGLIWIDTKEGKSIGLIKHAFWEKFENYEDNQILLFSKDYEKIPIEFIKSIKSWMKNNDISEPSIIRIVNKNLNITKLDTSLFN